MIYHIPPLGAERRPSSDATPRASGILSARWLQHFLVYKIWIPGPANMPNLYPLIRPVLRRLPAEAAHDFTLRALEAGLGRFMVDGAARDNPTRRYWRSACGGSIFRTRSGSLPASTRMPACPKRCAGFRLRLCRDRHRHAAAAAGQSESRGSFRLEQDQAIINRMGFNSGGLDAVDRPPGAASTTGIVGVNLGKNRRFRRRRCRLCGEGSAAAAKVADYLVVNVSSPNTPGLRELQRRESLQSLLRPAPSSARRKRASSAVAGEDCARSHRGGTRRHRSVALDAGIDGLIVSNTTVDRPAGLVSQAAREAGGLSGRPLFAASTALLADMYRLTQGRLPLIGVGGIASAVRCVPQDPRGRLLGAALYGARFCGPCLVSRNKARSCRIASARMVLPPIIEAVGAAQRHGPADSVRRACGAPPSLSRSRHLIRRAASSACAASTSCSNSVCVSQMRTLQRGIAPCFGHQRALVVSRRVEAKVAKRAPQARLPE